MTYQGCRSKVYSRFFEIIIIVLVLCIYTNKVFAARVVAEKRECAICHIAWMSDFKKKEIKTLTPYNPRPKVDTGRQDVVSTEAMCFSCHDGFVLDSRFLWLDGEHTHPVGVIPSDKVSIPKEDGKTIFPLNDDGKVYCGTCHSAHGVDWGSKQSPLFLRTDNINSSLCMTCHVDRKKQHDNHPLNKKILKKVSILNSSGSKFGSANEVICQSCHKVHSAKDKKLLVVQNDQSQLCETCHQDKSGNVSSEKAKSFTHPVGIIPNDVKISEKFIQSGSKFGPNKEIICQSCHTPHAAPSEKLLVLKSEQLKEGICIKCHEKQRSISNTGHNILKSKTASVAESELPSKNIGVCGVCHTMHSGQGPKMWARKLQPKGDKIAALCMSCHSDGAVAEKHTVGEYSHPVGRSVKKGTKLDQLPLFTSSGVKTSSTEHGLVTCPTCHDVHGPASKLSQDKSNTNKTLSRGKYLRKGEGDLLSLCKTCHEDKWAISKTKHDLTDESGEVKSLGICGNCHRVHNGNGPRMWSRDGVLNENAYGALCKNCHSKGAIAEKKTTGEHSHPVGVSINKAGINVRGNSWISEQEGKKINKKSPLPLYDSKETISQQTDAAVSCATCHDPHRWTTIKTSKNSSEGDKEDGDATNSFLRIPAAPDGELCVTCHRSKETVRATDHDLSVTAPNTTNILGETLTQSGVCGQCHTVHNAVQDLALWGRLPGPADNTPEMLCRSCHIAGEVAESKAPIVASHPSYVIAWDGELRDPDKREINNLPVFSDSGKNAMTGFITCPTCHNVHQWSAGTPKVGSGKNEEGDVFNSFLRMGSTEGILCADCHGQDSLFRYKYFHGIDFKKRLDK